MSLTDRLLKNSTLEHTAVINKSKIFGKGDMVQTSVPAINIALSGRVDGGLTPGLTVVAGPSKHFKSLFALLMAAAYLEKHKDAVMLFYDSEFGMPDAYLESFQIDRNRVVHCPITDIEQLKQDIMNQLKEINRGDKVIIVVDSVGNLASKKEVQDAIDQKSVADMTRAKALKSLGRMVTPHLTIKDIPMVVVNHVYDEISMFPKQIMGGGTGLYLSAHTIWFIGRQQEKDGTETIGYNFVINIEKSRYVKEKSKIPITVTWDHGIHKWSALFDIALELGVITSPSKGRYLLTSDGSEGTSFVKSKVITDDSFWTNLLTTTDFPSKIKELYSVAQKKMVDTSEGFDIDDEE